MFFVYYECHICRAKHKGDEQTPDTVAMIRGTKPNEWVFQCVQPCKPPTSKL